MTQEATNPPSRNAPCPCGSGKKFKRCCGAAPQSLEAATSHPPEKARPFSWLAAFGVLGFVALSVFALLTVERSAPADADDAAPNPAPWQYDPISDRHWHPEHGHWHEGPPPHASAANAQNSGDEATPQPWQYDAANDRYWHPEHDHWHEGRPPAPSAARE